MSARPRTMHELWPADDTRLLLRAALGDDQAAPSAFRAWLATHPPHALRDLARPDRRLLPLVAARLRSLGVDHPYLAVCDAAAAAARTRNEQLLEGAAHALTILGRAGVETLALKGVPLLLEHYGESAQRPMADVDLMVRPPDMVRALDALGAAGWRHGAMPRTLRRWVVAFDLVRDPHRQKLDLHQYLIEYGSSPEVERDLWARAHPIAVLGVPTLAPSPTDLLLHVCVAALKAGTRNSRWVPDAMLLLRAAGPGRVDWDLLTVEARRRGVALPLRECLQYLVDELAAPIPEASLAALWQIPITPEQVARYRVLTQLTPTLPQLAREYLSLYRFAARATGERPSPRGLAAYTSAQLALRWGIESVWQLPGMAIRKLAKKARS